jgi:putative membrane protein
MLGFLLTTVATALALLIVDIVFPGVDLANFPAAMLAAVVIGGVNSFIKPILQILSFPVTLLTLGFFALVVNGFCFWLASILVPGFVVKGLAAFLLGPVILSLASTFLNKYFADKALVGSASPSLPGQEPASLSGDR